MMNIRKELLHKNFQAIREKVDEATTKSGRQKGSVQIIPVTKHRSLEEMTALFEIGVNHFGENRVQEALRKKPFLPPTLVWHLIGTLQRKKAPLAAREFNYIHSVDSLEVAEALDSSAKQPVSVFLQVNPLLEGTKHGVPPEKVEFVFEKMIALPHLKVCGLMAMAPIRNSLFEGDVHVAFEKTQQLFLLLQEKYKTVDFKDLSMGMSSDFEEAILCGSTMVRIGSLFFDGLICE